MYSSLSGESYNLLSETELYNHEMYNTCSATSFMKKGDIPKVLYHNYTR